MRAKRHAECWNIVKAKRDMDPERVGLTDDYERDTF